MNQIKNLFWVHKNNNKGVLVLGNDVARLQNLINSRKIVRFSTQPIYSVEELEKSIDEDVAWLDAIESGCEERENEFVIFRSLLDEEQPLQAGVHLLDDTVLCLCCGGAFDPGEYEITGVIAWNALTTQIDPVTQTLKISL